MTPRDRRLLSDLREMEAVAESGRVMFRTEGNPPTLYRVMLNGPGLACARDNRLFLRELHRCEIYLHRDYPRKPPVVTWLTPVFHPNILGPERNGGTCVGSWSAGETLADLVERLHALITYRAFNANDALDPRAARFAVEHGLEPGLDVARLAGMAVDETELTIKGATAVK